MFPVVNKPLERSECGFGQAVMAHSLRASRSRERHEAFGQVNIKDVERLASSQCIIDTQVQGKRLLGAAPTPATSGVVGENSRADWSERSVKEAPVY